MGDRIDLAHAYCPPYTGEGWFSSTFTVVQPNAGHQARREAGAERTLYAVACMPWLGGG
jgi:hypothetical protein